MMSKIDGSVECAYAMMIQLQSIDRFISKKLNLDELF